VKPLFGPNLDSTAYKSNPGGLPAAETATPRRVTARKGLSDHVAAVGSQQATQIEVIFFFFYEIVISLPYKL